MADDGRPQTFAELKTDLQKRVKSDGGTAALVKLGRYINIGLLDMHLGNWEKFMWAERRAVLVLQPSYSTGTIAITQGTAALVGSSTRWATDNAATGEDNARAGGKIVIAGGKDVYEVATVGSDTAITLATPYRGSTETAGSYLYFEDDISLPADFLRPVDLQSFDDGGELPLISRTEFRNRFPRNSTVGRPRVAMIIDLAPSGNAEPRKRLVVHSPPGETPIYQIPYTYITTNLATSASGSAKVELVETTDEPIVPEQYRFGIVLHALKAWYRDEQDDSRSQAAASEYSTFMTRLTGDHQIGSNKPRFQPRISGYRSRARNPYRGAGRRFDIGGRFDRIDD